MSTGTGRRPPNTTRNSSQLGSSRSGLRRGPMINDALPIRARARVLGAKLEKETSNVLQHIDFANPQSSRRVGKNDPKRRRAVIDEIITEDCVFYDPSTDVYRAATRLIASWARSRLLILTLISANCRPRGVGQWWAGPMGTGRPGEPPTYAGTDFIIARDGRIAALYPFFDKLP